MDSIMRKFSLLLLAILFISCNNSVSDDEYITQTNNIYIKEYLYKKIPDKYNTGVDESKCILKHYEDGLINGAYIKIDTRSDKIYCLTSYIPKNVSELPSKVVIENYDFSDGDFKIYNPERYSEKKLLVFRNCRFKGFKNCGPYDNNKVSCEFDHCEFKGGVNEINITMNWCKIGGFPTDAMNPLKNFTVNNCFVYDLACEGNKKGTHIDGFQIYGRENTIGGNIVFDNVRFEIPSFYYENNTSYVNACVMLQLEYGNVNNCSFSNLICNGGGKWFPLYFKKTKSKVDGTYYKKGEEFPEENISLTNVKVSNNFGTIFYPTEHYENAKIENVTHLTDLYISSIFSDNNNKIHIICSNDTNTDKTLKVIADSKTYYFTIPHCPSNWALGGEIDRKVNPNESLVDFNGVSYKTYRYKNMPFDIDCSIDCYATSIECYDNSILLCSVK